MRKDTKAAFRNSDLGRAKPKRHFLKTFVNDNLKQQKRHHSDTGLVVDRTSPATVLRVILGLVVVHLLVIGGVMMRGSIAKSSSGLAVSPTIVPPPVAPAADPAPVQTAAVASPEPAPAPAAQQEVHITQGPVNMEAVTPVAAQPTAPVEPVAVQPTPAPAPPASRAEGCRHHVNTGDTWGRIAAQYGITEDVLKAANTELAALTNLPSGAYLNIPLPAGSTTTQTAAQPAARQEVQYHVVKRGENLGRIARKYRLNLETLLKLNNMTAADARRLQIGQKLRVSE
ncbi:MAG: LysM peptidoglycan-binding domain-containing protein [Akkermansia sp.]|nr:LysM peptidoglycan-binding domain-containing protein [Akkermansia sp.]